MTPLTPIKSLFSPPYGNCIFVAWVYSFNLNMLIICKFFTFICTMEIL
jgi:hypothetical protein